MTSMEEETKNPVVAGLEETLQKIQSALQPSIESHTTSESFSPKDGLDFLDVKNNLLLSYLIDLTIYIRDKSKGTSNENNLGRLTEMKTVLDKMGGLDKKLRYQIDKLMAASTTASTFAAGGDNNGPEDPLQFRPDPRAFQDGNSDSDGSDDEADEQNGDADDDLAAARATLSMANEKKPKRYQNGDDDDDDDNDEVYRAPRTTSVPYAHDKEQKQKEKEKRTMRRMRATELAQTLRAQYGDAPEQEDIHGGGDFGRQREAARRQTDREAEKTKYEESQMIRLTESRKEKKEKKRLMRMETSNLSAISDLGNLVRETNAFGNNGDADDDDDDAPMPEPGPGPGQDNKQRYDNGKRRRDRDEIEPSRPTRKGPKGGKAKNTLQAALYSTESKSSSKKKNTRR
jgi:U3 small nucleolar ribonucleoprotein protein LCP5